MRKNLESKINDEQSFGIDSLMLRKLSYNTIEEIFYGVHNFDVPTLYQYMNAAEILGLHAGIYKKYEDYTKILENVPLDIVLSKSVSFGYENSSRFRTKKERALYEISHQLERKDKNIFPITPGSLNSRMKSLGKRLKKKISSESQKPRVMEICDPNIDGHSKNVYIDYILKYYEEAYKMINDGYKKSINVFEN
jgi:hypothetical protein